MRDERMHRAQIRAQQAAHRLTELRERNLRLRSGAPPTATDVRSAGNAAARAASNAAQARQDATLAYRRAAEAHRQAAASLRIRGDLRRAAWHRDAAISDDAAAVQTEELRG
jgi:hypothetical protein